MQSRCGQCKAQARSSSAHLFPEAEVSAVEESPVPYNLRQECDRVLRSICFDVGKIHVIQERDQALRCRWAESSARALVDVHFDLLLGTIETARRGGNPVGRWFIHESSRCVGVSFTTEMQQETSLHFCLYCVPSSARDFEGSVRKPCDKIKRIKPFVRSFLGNSFFFQS